LGRAQGCSVGHPHAVLLQAGSGGAFCWLREQLSAQRDDLRGDRSDLRVVRGRTAQRFEPLGSGEADGDLLRVGQRRAVLIVQLRELPVGHQSAHLPEDLRNRGGQHEVTLRPSRDISRSR